MIDACNAYGFEMPQAVVDIFSGIRKTHNQGVFDAYTPEMRAVRKAGIITGLPDAYGRGRIIGDYRRVSLYGVDALIQDKLRELSELGFAFSNAGDGSCIWHRPDLGRVCRF